MTDTPKTYEFTAVKLRDPIAPKSDEWRDSAHHWIVTINGVSFDYFTGIGHREPLKGFGLKDGYDRLKGKNLTPHGLAELLKCSKATPPKCDDVLQDLVNDASAEDEGFPDWCSNLGYDTDSRKALQTYLDCQEIAQKLRKAKIDIRYERERLQDY